MSEFRLMSKRVCAFMSKGACQYNLMSWVVSQQTIIMSPGYEKALSRIDVELEMAVGNFELEVISPQEIQL